MSPIPARRRLLIAGARAAMGTALLGSGAAMRTALAGAVVEPAARGRVVGLVFERDGGLIKAHADALYRSSDDGRHWTPIALAPAAAPRRITAIAVSAGAKGSLYVAGFGSGVARSDDGGRRWSPRNQGLPSKNAAALATHADRPETVYACIADRGIFRSEDGGRRWRLMDAGPRGGITRLVHSNMPGSMQSGWLFAAAPRGVQRSMDCFCGWRDAGGLAQAIRAVAYDPRRPSDVYSASDAELFVSTDGGEKWSPTAAPATAIDAIVITPAGAILAADVDGAVFRRDGSAATWERVDD